MMNWLVTYGSELLLPMKTTCYICTAYKTNNEYNKCTFVPFVENLVGYLDLENVTSVKESKSNQYTSNTTIFPSVCPLPHSYFLKKIE
jgi:hypothetical protein